MNILIYNWRDIRNPGAGGAEVFMHEIARSRVKRGNDVMMFTTKFPGYEKVSTVTEWIHQVRILEQS